MKLKSFIFLVMLMISCLFQNVSGNIKNNIIVKIENEIITDYEIKNKILTLLFLGNQPINQENINKQKKEALNQLINHKLKRIELSKYNYKKNQNQINEYLRSLTSNNIQSFKEKFKTNNLNYDLFLDEIETQFKWQKLIYDIYAKKITLDEDSIDQEIENIKKNESSIVQFKLSEIEIPLSPTDNKKDKIAFYLGKIEEKGFESTALQYSVSLSASDKGDIGWINSKSLSKEFYEIVNNLKINDVSKGIIKQNSIIFLKLNDKKNQSLKILMKQNLKII